LAVITPSRHQSLRSGRNASEIVIQRFEALNERLQPHFGEMQIGIEGFSVRHIDYNAHLFDLLMGRRPMSSLTGVAR
jgi:hypothetical protein